MPSVFNLLSYLTEALPKCSSASFAFQSSRNLSPEKRTVLASTQTAAVWVKEVGQPTSSSLGEAQRKGSPAPEFSTREAEDLI